MCRLCAGNGDSRSGFSSDLPTLGMPGNPLMNLLLVQTSLGVCVEKCYGFALIVELWESLNTSDVQNHLF